MSISFLSFKASCNNFKFGNSLSFNKDEAPSSAKTMLHIESIGKSVNLRIITLVFSGKSHFILFL